MQTSYTPTAMNNDFALITLASEAPEACGYFGLYQPPSTGSVTVNITTAGAHPHALPWAFDNGSERVCSRPVAKLAYVSGAEQGSWSD